MDRQALDRECRAHRARLVAAAQRIMASREDAEDIVQWAFIKALTAPFDGRCKVSTWLHHIVIMKCLEVKRDRCRHAAVVVPEFETSCTIDSLIEARARLLSVLKQVDAMPVVDRSAIVDAVLGTDAANDSTTKNRLFRARLKLVA
ncbi:MAG: sigma factor [bacterium]